MPSRSGALSMSGVPRGFESTARVPRPRALRPTTSRSFHDQLRHIGTHAELPLARSNADHACNHSNARDRRHWAVQNDWFTANASARRGVSTRRERSASCECEEHEARPVCVAEMRMQGGGGAVAALSGQEVLRIDRVGAGAPRQRSSHRRVVRAGLALLCHSHDARSCVMLERSVCEMLREANGTPWKPSRDAPGEREPQGDERVFEVTFRPRSRANGLFARGGPRGENAARVRRR